MTTLQGAEVQNYLDNLSQRVKANISKECNGDLISALHTQMYEIIESEKRFLEYINQNGTEPILSISPNGLPSVASLKSDLETMCQLKENDGSFAEISEKYQTQLNGFKSDNKQENNEHTQNLDYRKVSEEEWEKEKQSYNKKELLITQRFSINETDERKLELMLRKSFYINGHDETSKNWPVLVNQGKVRYSVVWDNLISDTEQEFYVPNREIVLSKGEIQPSKNKLALVKENILEDYKALSTVSKKLAKIAIKTTYIIPTAPLMIPTYYRRMDEANWENTMGLTLISSGVGIWLSIWAGVSGSWLIPTAIAGTNALSGLYEWMRYEKNKLKRGLK